MDLLQCMRVFVGAAEEGSLSGAGRRLGLSPALASKYLGHLEDHLGVRLMNRTTRALHLTDEGQAYLSRAASVLADLDELEASVASRHAEPKGILRIAGPRAFGLDALAPAVAAFMVRHPDLVVELDLHERMVDVIGEGYDVAIRVSELKDSSFIARRITRYPYHVCASPDFLRARGRPQRPEELRRLPCIVITPISPQGTWTFVVDGKKVQVPVRARARTNTAQCAADMVRAGLGIGLCLHSTVHEDLEAGRLVRLLEPYWAYDRSVYAVYPTSKHLSTKVRVFVDFLLEHFAEPPAAARESR